jgi:hypothetical protein
MHFTRLLFTSGDKAARVGKAQGDDRSWHVLILIAALTDR